MMQNISAGQQQLQPNQPPPFITIGDIVQRTALYTYKELLTVFSNTNVDKELRYTLLKTFLSKAKRRLSQLLVIIRWFSRPETKRYFSDVAQVESHLSNLENGLNEAEFKLYQIHGNLFSQRVRALDVATAREILSSGSYPYFPAVISTRGTMPLPRPSHDDEDELRRSLNILLRGKIALHDRIPKSIDCADISGGLLVMRRLHLFELALTLKYASDEAPWLVIGFKLLIDSDNGGSDVNEGIKLNEVFNSEAYEGKVTAALRTFTAFPLPKFSPSTNSKDNATTDSVSMDVEDACKSHPSPTRTLSHLNSVCTHASAAVCLRVLHALALRTLQEHWKSYCLVEFAEKAEETMLGFRFWKGATSGSFLYQLRVVQNRWGGTKGEFEPLLRAELWALSSSSTSSTSSSALDSTKHNDETQYSSSSSSSTSTSSILPSATHFLSADTLIPGLSSRLSTNAAIIPRISFSSLLRGCIAICAESKLSILKERLSHTIAIALANDMSTQAARKQEATSSVLSINLIGTCLTLSHGLSYVKVNVCARTGLFTLAPHTLHPLTAEASKAVDAFLSEINNADAESICHAVEIDSGIYGHSDRNDESLISRGWDTTLKPVKTLHDLIVQLVVTHWRLMFINEAGLHSKPDFSSALLSQLPVPTPSSSNTVSNTPRHGAVFSLSTWSQLHAVNEAISARTKVTMNQRLIAVDGIYERDEERENSSNKRQRTGEPRESSHSFLMASSAYSFSPTNAYYLALVVSTDYSVSAYAVNASRVMNKWIALPQINSLKEVGVFPPTSQCSSPSSLVQSVLSSARATYDEEVVPVTASSLCEKVCRELKLALFSGISKVGTLSASDLNPEATGQSLAIWTDSCSVSIVSFESTLTSSASSSLTPSINPFESLSKASSNQSITVAFYISDPSSSSSRTAGSVEILSSNSLLALQSQNTCIGSITITIIPHTKIDKTDSRSYECKLVCTSFMPPAASPVSYDQHSTLSISEYVALAHHYCQAVLSSSSMPLSLTSFVKEVACMRPLLNFFWFMHSHIDVQKKMLRLLAFECNLWSEDERQAFVWLAVESNSPGSSASSSSTTLSARTTSSFLLLTASTNSTTAYVKKMSSSSPPFTSHSNASNAEKVLATLGDGDNIEGVTRIHDFTTFQAFLNSI